MLGGSVAATLSEQSQRMPGDDSIATPLGSFTHAITIDASPETIWPWLVQMGVGRAGWYSYDWLDNGGKASAEVLLPEHQTMAVGGVMPATRGATDAFIVRLMEPPHALVLAWGSPPITTWAFALRPGAGQGTRLVTRVRGARGYRLFGLPPAVTRHLVRLVHGVMQRRQLQGLKRRAERAASS